MKCRACTRGFHQHCGLACQCECREPKCGIVENGQRCGRPAFTRGVFTGCTEHFLKTMALIGALMEEELAGSTGTPSR